MWSGTVAKGESSTQVPSKMLHLLDVLQQCAVNALLHCTQLLMPLLLMSLALSCQLKSVLRSVLKFVLGESLSLSEESVINISVDAIERDAGGGGKHVSRVDSAQRHSIDAVRSSHEQVSRSESLKDNNASASVGARKKDNH